MTEEIFGRKRNRMIPGVGYLDVFLDALPADGSQGYAPGCVLMLNGSHEMYVNHGTLAACAFRGLTSGEAMAAGFLRRRHVNDEINEIGGLYNPLPVRVLLGMQDDETWTQEGGTVAPDLENYVLGRQSLKLTASTGSSARAVCTPSAVNSDDVRQIRGNLGVWIRVDTVANLNWIYLELYPDSGVGGSYYKYYPYKQDGPQYNKHALQDGQWHLCWIPATVDTNVWAKTGTPPDYGTATSSPLPVQKMRVSVGANANGNVNAWIGGFLALEPPKAGLVIGFDGPYRSAFDYGCRRMLERGYIGVAHARAATMQDESHITISEWQELYAAGWDCGPHPSDGTAFNDTTPAATVAACIAREVAAFQRILGPRGAQAISWLANNGESAACPETGDKAGDIAKKMCLAARAKSVFGQTANRAGAGLNVFWDGKYSPWIPVNWWCLPFRSGSHSSQGWDFASNMKGFLDATINMRQVANIYIHRIKPNTDTPDDLNVSEGWFDALMDYVAEHLAAGDLELLTYSTWQSKVCGRMGSYGCTLDGVPTYIAGGSTRRWPGSPD